MHVAMSTEYPGTPKWTLRVIADVLVRVPFWLFIVWVVATPALTIFGSFDPRFEPFIWLAMAGLTFGMVGYTRSNEDLEIEYVAEQIDQMNARERLIYVTSWVFFLITSVSLHVGLIGMLGGLIAIQTEFVVVGALFAFWVPPLDAWIGRQTGVSVGLLGLSVAIYIMKGVAVLQAVSPEIPEQVGAQVRPVFQPA